MRQRFFLASFLVLVCLRPCAAQQVQTQLSFNPATTLPALPVTVRVTIANESETPFVAVSMNVAMENAVTGIHKATLSLPTPWPSTREKAGDTTVPPKTTLDFIALIDPWFAQNELFLTGELPLWKPGRYSLTVTVEALDGTTSTSNAASLTIRTPQGDDATIWNELSQGGDSPFISMTLFERFDELAPYPTSFYYRHVAPFYLHVASKNNDSYASQVLSGLTGQTGAFIDSARAAIAFRYLESASGQHGINRQTTAGTLSAQGRVYAQQLVDTPASPIGAIVGKSLLSLLPTTAEWQALYDATHTGRTGWVPSN